MAELNQPHYGGVIDPNDANDPRSRIVRLVAPGSAALEIGCGSGTIISYLARAKGCRTLAVEPDPVMADETRALGVEVLQGAIDDAAMQEQLAARAPFDAIILADVLEHLRDPWAVLAAVRPWLAPGGAVLASVPNVAHWSMRLMLLRGQWNYTDGYLMDRTHLRWFTRRTLHALFTSTGYRVVDSQVRWAALPGDRLWRRVIPGRTRLYGALAALSPTLFGYQFVIRAEAA
ncbi:MAG: class I SAM-dependent methyltransferase [Anaerolineae bacterium]